MGKRDRLARAARKRQKASVQALGRDVGGVDEAVKGHKRQQEERAELYRQAEVNIAENPETFKKSGWKQNDVAMRMSMSCPMCGSETMYECVCCLQEDGVYDHELEFDVEELQTQMKDIKINFQTPTQQKPKQSKTATDEGKKCVARELPKRVLQLDTPVKK